MALLLKALSKGHPRETRVWLALFSSQFSQACACELEAALWPPFPLLLLTEEMELEMDESLVRDNLIYSYDFLKPVESCLFV